MKKSLLLKITGLAIAIIGLASLIILFIFVSNGLTPECGDAFNKIVGFSTGALICGWLICIGGLTITERESG